jgi:hypothetical protein
MGHQLMALLEDHLFYKTPSLRSLESTRERLPKKKIHLVAITRETDHHSEIEIKYQSKITVLS